MSDTDLFESPKVSIQGAEEAIAQIAVACVTFSEMNSYEIVTDSDRKTNEKIVYIRLNNKLAAGTRSSISTVIKNLRTTLDQAVCSSVSLLTPDKRLDNIYFPVGKSIDDLDRSIKRIAPKVHPNIIAVCQSFKPHYEEDSDGMLWAISHLAGLTHRKIIEVRPQDGMGFLKAVAEGYVVGPLEIILNRWDHSKNHFEVARLQSSRSRLQIQTGFPFPIEVIFSSGAHAFGGRPVLPSLKYMLGITKKIVFAIEIETLRLLK